MVLRHTLNRDFCDSNYIGTHSSDRGTNSLFFPPSMHDAKWVRRQSRCLRTSSDFGLPRFNQRCFSPLSAPAAMAKNSRKVLHVQHPMQQLHADAFPEHTQ